MIRKKKVLIIDDEAIVCERLGPALEKVGFYVETCTRSQQAIERLGTAKFDVLVTDLKMPETDGLEIMRFAKQQAPSTKVIIITGFATLETARRAMSDGAVDFIAKPFKISQLRDLILKVTTEEEASSG